MRKERKASSVEILRFMIVAEPGKSAGPMREYLMYLAKSILSNLTAMNKLP
jgi:hypothetical protein